MNELMNELINYEAVYRTAPATPGLLTSDGGDCRTAPATQGLLIKIQLVFIVQLSLKGRFTNKT